MLPKISVEFLESIQACKSGIEAYIKCGKPENLLDALDMCKIKKYYKYAVWLTTKLLNHQNTVKFAIYCAELVLPLYEKKYAEDKRPREAIAAARAAKAAAASAAAYDAAYAVNAANEAAAYAAAAEAAAASDYLTHINQTIEYAKTLLKEQYENV